MASTFQFMVRWHIALLATNTFLTFYKIQQTGTCCLNVRLTTDWCMQGAVAGPRITPAKSYCSQRLPLTFNSNTSAYANTIYPLPHAIGLLDKCFPRRTGRWHGSFAESPKICIQCGHSENPIVRLPSSFPNKRVNVWRSLCFPEKGMLH